MLLTKLLSYLTSFLNFTEIIPHEPTQTESNELIFRLKHLHGHTGSRILFSDVLSPTSNAFSSISDNIRGIHTQRIRTSFIPNRDEIESARRISMTLGESAVLQWEEDEVEGPDVGRRETLLALAKMTYNAYVCPLLPLSVNLNPVARTLKLC